MYKTILAISGIILGIVVVFYQINTIRTQAYTAQLDKLSWSKSQDITAKAMRVNARNKKWYNSINKGINNLPDKDLDKPISPKLKELLHEAEL
jgi:hypothetical protein